MKASIPICCALAIALSALLGALPSYSQRLFACEDTQYRSSDEFAFLRSSYHLFQVFGDASYRDTNFFEAKYNGSVAWTETRFLFPYFSEFTKLPLPDLYFTGLLKVLKDIDWEDRLDYGIGIEWRPLKYVDLPEGVFLKWTGHLRFYAVYFKTAYLQDVEAWRPGADLRVGVELYRECNLYSGDADDENVFWAEFWADGSWRRTNFFIDDYKSWMFAFVPKVGIRLFSGSEVAVMPYVTGEIALTERSEFWQNRILAGGGIRIMPFRWQNGMTGVFLRGARIFAEGLWVVKYLKDEPPSGIPSRDVRLGINFTINRW